MKNKVNSILIKVFLAIFIVLFLSYPIPGNKRVLAQEGNDPENDQPTLGTTRHGGWLDEIDFSVVDSASVIAAISAGTIDLFSYGLPTSYKPAIDAAGLCSSQSYGIYYDYLFNPAVFTDTNKLNPFTNRKIREAMNWLVDRDYLNETIYAGGALPKFFALATHLVDYTRIVDVARSLEANYAYDPVKANFVVSTEMTAMGATKVAGKWNYNGAPVKLIFLIRNDGDGTRLPMGEYFANQLESIGFTVSRQIKKSSELSPIWIGSNPPDGLWNLYTAGWGSSGLTRDEKTIFQEMYLPNSPQGIPLFSFNVPDPIFQQVGDDLAYGNFNTFEQRQALMTQALPLSLQDSLQVWTVDLQIYTPYNCGLQVSSGLGSGTETTKMTPFNLRFNGVEGGAARSASAISPFTDPWNPIAGANWTSSAFVQSTVQGDALMPDPYTGLAWPLRADHAEVTVQTGLPVSSTLPWVTLSTAATIDVPADAWVDWDATTQKFITAVQKYPGGITARVKSIIYYPADMFTTVKWHDGSNLSVADFVMQMIMLFDRAKAESAIYDADTIGNLDAFLSHFKGVKILSTSPLTIATYDDNFNADAELNVTTWWPQYGYGEAPWQSIAVGNLADAAGALAWGWGKADRNAVEWTNFIGGASLGILDGYLDQAITDTTIPYAPTMSTYITSGDATTRYAALKSWYTTRSHFWDGTGPYYLFSANSGSSTGVVKNNTNYPDLADRWVNFTSPKLPEISVEAYGPVVRNEASSFLFHVDNDGSPYPPSEIDHVSYLLFGTDEKLIDSGLATFFTDGQYIVSLDAATTLQLQEGTNKLELIVGVIPVATPTYFNLEFSVTPGALPVAFSKSAPADSTSNLPVSVTLSWAPSTAATSYWYCYDKTDDNTCTNWVNNGTGTSKSLTGLAANTTYYWQVRSKNTIGLTYANGSSTSFWSFTTGILPGTFTRSAPVNATINQPLSLTLSWAASSNVSSYWYCYDTTNDNACTTWVNNGTSTSKVLNGLSTNTTYYWHVRAVNATGMKYADGSSIAFWSFTTGTLPGAFTRSAPVNAATNRPSSLTLSWTASAGAISYWFCADTTNDNACTGWVNNGSSTSVAMKGLAGNTTYYWQVRSKNAIGITYASGNSRSYWTFTTGTLPGAFTKITPANGAINQTVNPTLSWAASAGATSYSYCFDKTNDNICTNWTSNGMATSKALSGLTPNTTYYWHVKANNAIGPTYASGSSTAFWSFTTASPLGAFARIAPVFGAVNQPVNPTLSWSSSSGATSYWYCFDTTDDLHCTNWVNNGTAISKMLNNLSPNTTYYWHVRAVNALGVKYADDYELVFWRFTTGSLPGAFNKSTPANGAIDQPLSLTLNWGASTGAISYWYCYDTTNDNVCSNWLNNGTATSKAISGLTPNTTYYWHIRAKNSIGITYSEGSSTAFWSFKTIP